VSSSLLVITYYNTQVLPTAASCKMNKHM